MAIFSYTQNGILFNNLNNAPKPVKKVPGKIFNSNNDYEYATDGIEMTIDTVTIDWNGAQVAGKTLNTTGDMLSILQTAYNYATTYTGKTTLTSSTQLGKINGKSLTYGGSIDIEVGSNITESTISGWGFTKNTGTVKSVNNSSPDQNGNVNITVGTNVTETTVSNWGFTKNTGTVTGIKMNGNSKGTNGVVDLGTVIVNISDNYQTNTNNNTALSTSGAYILYSDLSESIDNLQTSMTLMQNTIDNLQYNLESLTSRVTALEKYHATVPVSSIKLNKTSLTLTGKDATASLSATVEPTNATNKAIKWESDNPKVVTVSSTGQVTAKGVSVSGIPTIITAAATDGSGISATCSVTVNDGTVTISGITPQNPTIEEGQTQEFRVSYTNTSFDDVKFTWTVKQGDVEYNNLINSSSTSSNIVLFTAPTFVSTSAELYTYTLTVTEGISASGANTSSTTITVTKKEELVSNYWYVGNENPMDTGMATNINTSALTFTLNKSHNLLQTATSYTDLVGKEFAFPNHFVIPTEWLNKIQIVNANDAPWAWGTTVIDSTNKYTWCWNSGTGTGTFKIVAK